LDGSGIWGFNHNYFISKKLIGLLDSLPNIFAYVDS